jgi:hypothetical protein
VLPVLPCLPSLALVGGTAAAFAVLTLPLAGNLTATAAINRSIALAGKAGGPAGYAEGSGAAVRFGTLGGGLSVSPDGSFALVADGGYRVLRRLGLAFGDVTTFAGQAGSGGAADGAGTAASFGAPAGVALSPDGAFALVADAGKRICFTKIAL